ncbi:hypothetical protein AZE42_01559 [Rhizopogon vesiculosus]|uniref:Uncharacterized protein n=1 Tax=Rhizopogon vesiculosus TaxID=180088 RepID=A0A1J8QLP5_9AGAM|nr:hypothetical protein AZE42_01559 [Rhizopogon vesiculosus]
MDNAANAARCDVTGSLKHNGLQYMLNDQGMDHFDPPILKSHGKDGTTQSLQDYYVLRGISRNLMRIHSIAYMDKVNSGEKKISAKQWPSMFYDMSLYDPTNKKQRFLRSRVVIQHGAISSQGPLSTVSKERTGRSSKPGKGRMHHLTEPGA